MLMTSPVMAVSPWLSAAGQQRIPLVSSPFGPPTVDRDLLPSTVAPPDPRQFCVPSQFGSSVLPNANLANMLSGRIYSGWGLLPPESIKAVARRNELIQRHHTARTKMEMFAIYQQRRMEKVHPQGLAGLGVPILCGPAGPAACPAPSALPAGDLRVPRSALRSLQGNPMLVATGTHGTESWGQKCRRLRKGAGNLKVLDRGTENSKSPAGGELLPRRTHALPRAETAALTGLASSAPVAPPPTARPGSCGERDPAAGEAWGYRAAPQDTEAGGAEREEPSEQVSAACGEKRAVCAPAAPSPPPGPGALVTAGGNLSLDGDIQKWTVGDVHSFIRRLPGCADCAQVFKDHGIDGETLPLLTEEHLRGTMGLKLGPALKIQSQVSQHLGSVFYKKSLPLPAQARPAAEPAADPTPLLESSSWRETLSIPCSRDMILPKAIEQDSMRN
ncbi:sterile alpha motif domain-containing protein 7 isoform X2 [Nycticebus coucang]|uniref:sterile alpha motif domain-containing protein 7 isoform X2 n=1 Tax=Nycticebus coucang TaxID=9470 RepID=UPI00234C9B27|nr:sterile alpha motif domain-containing protein 7 isoform X2 [Nycticebus coucang]